MYTDTTLTTFESLVRIRQKSKNGRAGNVDSSQVMAKVVEDIHFLRNRIEHIKKTSIAHNNPFILKTYESMLESRETVLASLADTSDLFTEPYTEESRPRANFS